MKASLQEARFSRPVHAFALAVVALLWGAETSIAASSPAVAAIQSQIAQNHRRAQEIHSEIHKLRIMKINAMAEIARGEICSDCNQTRLEIEAQGEQFPHPGRQILRQSAAEIAAKQKAKAREFEEKTSCILMNPVRKGCCERAEDWPWIYRPMDRPPPQLDCQGRQGAVSSPRRGGSQTGSRRGETARPAFPLRHPMLCPPQTPRCHSAPPLQASSSLHPPRNSDRTTTAEDTESVFEKWVARAT